MQLDKNQADAIADALLQPGQEHQIAARERRAAAGHDRATRRFLAVCSLVGFAAGGVVGYLVSVPIVRSALVGGICAMLLGRIYKWAVAGQSPG